MPFSNTWFDQNIPTWTTYLSKFKDQPIYGIEIGCFEGRSTVWLMENIFTHYQSRLICIDTFKGSEEHNPEMVKDLLARFSENVKPYEGKINAIQGKSQEVIRQPFFGYTPDNEMFSTYDFIYIDGSHKAADVLEDAVLCWRLVNPGGIMIFDDYKWQEYQGTLHHPQPGIDAFLYVFGGQYKLLHKDYQVIVEKL